MKKKWRNTFLGINFLLGVSTIISIGTFFVVKNNQNNEINLENDKNLYSKTDDKTLKSFTGTVLTANDVAALGWNNATTIGATDWGLQAPNVIEIAKNAFLRQTMLEFMFIPKKIKKIGVYAFGNTSAMKTLLFHPNSELETIGGFCFGGSGLTSIELPSSLLTLGRNAFEYSTSLTSVIFAPNPKITVIESWIFYHTPIRSFVVPDSVLTINNNAFDFAKSLISIIISENSNLKYILTAAFKDTDITSIYIPDTVVEMKENIFLNTPFLKGENVSISIEWKKNSSTPLYGFTQAQWNAINWRMKQFIGIVLTAKDVENLGWDKKKTITLNDWKIWAPNVEDIGSGAFGNKVNLSSIDIPDNVEAIYESAFKGTKNLKTVNITLNSKLISIGNSAFDNSGVTSINIPNQVSSIGEYAFNQTPSLTSVTFSTNSKLSTIGVSAFNESNIGSINIPDSVTSIGENAFQGTTSLLGENISILISLRNDSTTPLYGFTQIQWNAINWRQNLIEPFMGEILRKENVVALGWDAKMWITLIDWREWAPNVTEIQGAFENVITLESIEIPAKITTLNSSSFAVTTTLKLVVFEANSKLTTIGNTIFKDSGITSISIPESVTLIGENAFLNTESLTNIEMNIRFKENISSSNYGFTESQISKIKWIDPSDFLSQSGNVILLSVGLSVVAIVVIGFGLFITIKIIKRDES